MMKRAYKSPEIELNKLDENVVTASVGVDASDVFGGLGDSSTTGEKDNPFA